MDKFSDGMRFRTEASHPSACLDLSYDSRFFTVGSCFADQIGSKLRDHKFRVTINPFGAVYDPFSIHRLLNYALFNELPGPDSFIERDGIYYCDELHSSIHAADPQLLKEKISILINQCHEQLVKSDVILITYGTAWTYSRIDSSRQVANCHKLPGNLFFKRLIEPNDLVQSFKEIYSLLKNINPKIEFVLTVSPVRHLKDTLELNAVSKSVLRLAVHQLSDLPGVYYYPAYEIMNDDLRDYRYYELDMIHPNQQAIDYIWTHLQYFFFEMDTRSLMEKYEKIIRSLSHRPFHPNSSAHRKFLVALIKEMSELNEQMDLSNELTEIQTQLKASEQ